MAATLSAPVRLVFVVDQIVGVVIAHQDHVSAPAAIAAVGSAPRFILLPTEAHAAAPTITGLKFNYTLVDEHLANHAERAAFAKGWIQRLQKRLGQTLPFDRPPRAVFPEKAAP